MNTKQYLKTEIKSRINKYCINCYHNQLCDNCSLNTDDYTISQDIEYKNHLKDLDEYNNSIWGV